MTQSNSFEETGESSKESNWLLPVLDKGKSISIFFMVDDSVYFMENIFINTRYYQGNLMFSLIYAWDWFSENETHSYLESEKKRFYTMNRCTCNITIVDDENDEDTNENQQAGAGSSNMAIDILMELEYAGLEKVKDKFERKEEEEDDGLSLQEVCTIFFWLII